MCPFMRPGMTSLPRPVIVRSTTGAPRSAPMLSMRSPSITMSPLNGMAPRSGLIARMVAPLMKVRISVAPPGRRDGRTPHPKSCKLHATRDPSDVVVDAGVLDGVPEILEEGILDERAGDA